MHIRFIRKVISVMRTQSAKKGFELHSFLNKVSQEVLSLDQELINTVFSEAS